MIKILYTLLFFVIFSNTIYSQNCQWVFVEGGKFKMGSTKSPDELPIHKVKVNNFYILDHEVTNLEFVRFLNIFGNKFEGNAPWIRLTGRWRDERCRIYMKDSIFYVEKGYEDYPVTYVSWWGAEHYAEWIGGRLPSEAEWEYIANKMLQTQTQEISQYAWFKENSGNTLHKVKTKQPIMEIYDLFGNMAEWCYDWYSKDYYSKKIKDNPTGPKKGRQKVNRGLCWASKQKSFYISNRRAVIPAENNITIGFRVVIPTK